MYDGLLSVINWVVGLIIMIIITIIYVIKDCVLSRNQHDASAPVTERTTERTTELTTSIPPVTEHTDNSTQPVTEPTTYTGRGISNVKYKMLSFNVEYEAENYSPADVVEIIHTLGADIIVLNEAHSAEGRLIHKDSSKIADALTTAKINHVYSHDWAIIASTKPIVQPYRSHGNKYIDTAALINDTIYVLSAHLTDYPYQPFQLAHIPYCYDTCQVNICADSVKTSVETSVETPVKTPVETSMYPKFPQSNDSQNDNSHQSCSKGSAEKQMIEQATLARGEEINLIIEAIQYIRDNNNDNIPILIAGDFNEPSHLDWSDAAVVAGQQPLSVKFPSSSRLASAGLIDIFREVHPDPVKNPGFTWPARSLTSKELGEISQGELTKPVSTPTDRIDFIYGSGVTAISADVVVTPSDHHAVIAEIALS